MVWSSSNDKADHAVSQRRHRLVRFRQDIAIEITEIAGILKRKNLSAPVLGHFVSACEAVQQHG
jgi:hypothetical protein